MKALKISSFFLAAMLLFSVIGGLRIGRRCRVWQAQIRSVDALAARGDRAAAEKKLDALYLDWQDAQSYLNITVHRDTLDTVESCFRSAAALLSSEDTASLHAALAELSARLQFLADAQRPLPKNIF